MSIADRRLEPRAKTKELLVRVEGYCLQRYGYVHDISSSGMQLRTFTTCDPYPFDREKEIRVRFSLPEKDVELDCRTELVWHEHPAGGSIATVRQGVRFTEIAPEARREIEDWVMWNS